MTPDRFWDVVEEQRELFLRAGFTLVRRTHIVLDPSIDTWAQGGRTVGETTADGKTIYLSPRLATFDEDRVAAVAAHELGHAVQGLYGDISPDPDRIEQDADALAERATGRRLFYSMRDARLLQTFHSGIRPRPRGLR